MSIEISLGVKRTITEHVNGSFTTNHPEDDVSEWINSGGLECETNELSSYIHTDETCWEPISLHTESYIEYEDPEYFQKILPNDFKFDDEIQPGPNHHRNNRLPNELRPSSLSKPLRHVYKFHCLCR